MERKVIIRGHVFDYEEKAPFVVSGQSLLGAVEYDPVQEKVKCHECGGWFRYVAGTHLRFTHKLASLAYKLRHGINVKSPICAPSFSAIRGKQHKPTAEQTAVLVEAGRLHKRLYGNNLTNRVGHNYERANATNRCQAQTLFRIQLLAADLGHTPSSDEMCAVGLDQPLLVRNFGNRRKAVEIAGLEPRPTGTPGKFSICNSCPLPPGFPSKDELLKKKEPWFATPRCSERGCIFPAQENGMCAQHKRMFEPSSWLLKYESSLAGSAH
jgi:ROS/MUCR transcriptional regulator protein